MIVGQFSDRTKKQIVLSFPAFLSAAVSDPGSEKQIDFIFFTFLSASVTDPSDKEQIDSYFSTLLSAAFTNPSDLKQIVYYFRLFHLPELLAATRNTNPIRGRFSDRAEKQTVPGSKDYLSLNMHPYL